MLDAEALKKLADLARISIDEDELATLGGELDAMVAFVGVVQSREGESGESILDKENVFRDDAVAPLVSEYDLIEAAPLHRDHYVEVPKVIE
ncbi:MAG TPA: Asp-tRNA(Asn)/Glu-tRNA(Gln) amidotransferase subunit GatC [Candidatus Paceibacterota bacterium]|nr:Asp-tRNA(Asn)/Glu-tRNA(Gln) amidotransferase subunit GatC [Candidatus Paceibacterota bacterium]